MRIDLVKKLVVYKLSSARSDRRGPVCDLILADIPNAEYAINVATRILQRVCSLLGNAYFWSSKRDEGPTEFEEQFESWIGSLINVRHRVRIWHKYWTDDKVEAFVEIMLVLARLHGWEVEDRRG